MRIVLSRLFPGDPASKLAPHYDEVVECEKGRPLTSFELGKLLTDADAAVVTVTDRVDERALASAGRLKAIFSFSVGLDHLDLTALSRRGIRVTYTPGVLTDATADLAVALILATSRRVVESARVLEQRKFRGFGPNDFLGLELRGATVGIVGMGRIGRAVARRLDGFGASVIYTGPKKRVKYPWATKSALLKRSDIVSLHCPLNESTRHWIGAGELLAMKRSAILINCARGPIVDEKALTAHLLNHAEFRAGLDVFEREPEVTAGLLAMDNALCVPHIGSATVASRGQMAAICVSEAIRFALGKPLHYEYRGKKIG